MKRYAIVRVDDDYKHLCPSGFEKVDDSSFCKLAKQKGGSCNCCPYGDTKEQLVRKVAQALERTITDGVYVRFGIPITVEKLAKEIVEFLGVE